MKIFPAVHYTMGGLYTTFEANDDKKGMKLGAHNSMMTNIQGLYALGEVNYQYHGGTRLGANALLSCIFDGLFCGDGIAAYARDGKGTPAGEMPQGIFDRAVQQEEAKVKKFIDTAGSDGENPYLIAKEMGEEMTASSTVVKTEERMLQAMDKIRELQERFQKVSLSDSGMWTNQNLSFTRAVGDMLLQAEVILQGGIDRKESRGSHYRPDYPERNDERFLKTTVAAHDQESGRPKLWYEDVDIELVPPRARTYGKSAADDDKKNGQAEPAPAEKEKEAAEVAPSQHQ
jgi:succinate dehydrogenase / fumarate reductase flavoprotein subunit